MFSPSRVIMLITITAPLAGAPRVVGQVSATAKVQVLKPPIDPGLSYSTYLDTAPGDSPAVGAWDSSGNACIAFNSTQVKLRSDGSVVYSNSNFAGPQPGYYAVAIDSQGSCYVAGRGPIIPTAGVFQTSAGSQQFVMKFDPSGAITYATYLGGSGTDMPAALAVDSLGNAYLTGFTASNDFPTARAFQPSYGGGSDAFIAVLNPNGTALVYSTYLGGSGYDGANSVAVDGAGNAVVAGGTFSADFPTRAAFQPALAGLSNAFVVKLDPAGNLVYSSFLGGAGTPQYPIVATSAFGAAIDSNGNAYLTGSAGDGFPLMNPLQTTPNGAFITKINPSGSALLYSTYLGVHTTGVAIAVDSSGLAYIGGIINAFTDSPTSPPASLPLVSPIQSTYSTLGGFVSVLDATGSSLLFSTFLGGGFSSRGVMNLAVDSVGNIYASGQSSLGFPIVNAVNGTYEPDHHIQQPTAFKIAPVSGPVLASPTMVDFKYEPCVVGTSCGPDAEVLVANAASTGTITISGITVAGDYSQTNNCPQTLLAATNCVLSVTFTPTAGGTRTGTITIADDAPGNPHVINLIGIGTNSGLGLAIPSGGSGSATVSAGQSASYTLSIGGAGMSGTAALSCIGAPTGASCSVPASQSLSSTTASTITVTVSTASRMLAATSSPTSQRSPWLWAFFVLGIVAIRERSKPKRSRLRHVWLVLPLFLASCGGGGGPQQNPNGTPAGNYTLTVAATSGSVTEKVSLTLTVQ